MISRFLVRLGRRLCRHRNVSHIQRTSAVSGCVLRRTLICSDCGAVLVDTVVLPPDCGKSLPAEVADVLNSPDVESLYAMSKDALLNKVYDRFLKQDNEARVAFARTDENLRRLIAFANEDAELSR